MANDEKEQHFYDVPVLEPPAALSQLNRAEMDVAIATAKRYPRSIQRFQAEVRNLCCLNDTVAESCLYALPRTKRDGGEVKIEGPGIRFAEIVLSAWGNARAMGRVLDTEGTHVVAQGVFVDLERNITVSKETWRRIVDKHGRRYTEDMIIVTANAAASIATRNAILAGVPRAIWNSAYEDAKLTAAGTLETLADRRAAAMDWLEKSQGVGPGRVFLALGVDGVEDIGLEELAALRGLVNAVKQGELKTDQAFPKSVEPSGPQARGVSAVRAKASAEPIPS